MVKYYDNSVGVVCSFSISEPKNLFRGVQAFDWLYLLTLSSGSAGINDQLSCVGNNMSYRRKAYEDVGGYENMKFSVTEDFMLLQTIKRKTNWKTKFPVNLRTLHYTQPCPTIRELYRQKKRWGRGGLDINWFGYLVGFIGWCSASLILFSWLFAGFKIYLIFLLSKIFIDFLFTFPVIIRFKRHALLLYLIPFELYFALYAFFLPFIVGFGRTVIWKSQKL
jgi:cellulose synthase/poly-beta-1,6-N-acetylglucosamine synthase-like glycosyltransferase